MKQQFALLRRDLANAADTVADIHFRSRHGMCMAIGLDNPQFSDALVILGAAGLVIPAFARFRISPVIGFILVGLLVGPAGLGS
jgi:hypothetical protein